MINRIETMADVAFFTKAIIDEGVNLHPDTDFREYANLLTNENTYSDTEAETRNELMSQAFSVCEKNGVDIYDFMCEIFLKATCLDQFIPLPSAILSDDYFSQG
ncbi:MAG: hypothetical protein HGA99_09805 [Chlorobiaceae bacterium]|nr:hypothetical protein [Chlorobiaceae bacterium]